MFCSNSGATFEVLLDYLWKKYHFDFNAYKHSSLVRRIEQRMHDLSINTYSQYIHYLEANSEEFTQLLNTVGVNLTCFFRDKADWNYLSNHIIPRILASKSADEPIRVWSAGCAFGQETYTLAIILAEALGIENFCQRVLIYATDIDEEALNQARQGSYFSHLVTEVTASLLNKYFQLKNNLYVFRTDLRRCIHFHRRNIFQNAPPSKMDLVVCRNTLIYFNLDAQTKALVRIYFSLRNSGFLFMGRSEMIAPPNLFSPISIEHRIFSKLPNPNFEPEQLIKAFTGRCRTKAKQE